MAHEITIQGIHSGRTFLRGSQIGEGQGGKVYKATEKAKPYAIKFAHRNDTTDHASALLREAAIQMRFSHPHITPAELPDEWWDNEVHDYIPFMPMPLADMSLRKRVATFPLSIDDAITVGLHIADALGHIHQEDILHADPHYGNVLLFRAGTDQFTAKLTDFGAAGYQDEIRTSSPDTQQYADPPEFLNGIYTAASDQYSWATKIIYPAVTKHWYREVVTHTVEEGGLIQRVPLTLLIPTQQRNAHAEALEEVVDRAVKSDPQERYPTMGELQDDLATRNAYATEYRSRQRRYIA